MVSALSRWMVSLKLRKGGELEVNAFDNQVIGEGNAGGQAFDRFVEVIGFDVVITGVDASVVDAPDAEGV